MNIRHLPVVIAIGAALSVSSALAQTSNVSVRVEQQSKSDLTKEDLINRTQNQERTLKVFITNAGNDPLDLKVKYTYFGREMTKGHAIVSISSGEQAATVKGHGTETAEMPPAKTTAVEEHYAKGSKTKAGAKIDASGARFIGYAVQVFQGDKMVAEAYEPMSVKDSVGKAGEAPKAEAPKK